MPSIRVDEVPRLLRPLLAAYGGALAFLLLVYVRIVRWTSRIEVRGRDALGGGNHILCHWHTFIPVYFTVFTRHTRHAWMQHAAWKMKPIHQLLHWIGVERLVLGSSGHGGRRAADELVELLREGWSTAVFPDGPAGPPFQLHKGVVHMSRQSGVPIVPIQFALTRYFRLPTWDRKVVPLPFGRIAATFGSAFDLSGMELDEAARAVEAALGRDIDRA